MEKGGMDLLHMQMLILKQTLFIVGFLEDFCDILESE